MIAPGTISGLLIVAVLFLAILAAWAELNSSHSTVAGIFDPPLLHTEPRVMLALTVGGISLKRRFVSSAALQAGTR